MYLKFNWHQMLRLFFNKINLKPATLAVLIQAVAFFFVFSFAWIVKSQSLYVISAMPMWFISFLVLMQATVAAWFANITNMAKWWRWIHFIFPLAVWVMSQLHVPNAIYLIGFLLSLSLYWTTFRTQVPFFPSTAAVRQQVLTFIPQHQPMRIIDIGSGLGDMSMYIAKVRPDCLVNGIEIAPLPWLISVVRAKLKGSKADFRIGDYRLLNFANYDLIFAYLSPAAMSDLWQKAQAEMRSGALLISYEFEIEGVESTEVIQAGDNEKMLYVWKIK
ncbi:class I SAM-dependent methyltransferase [Methylotenera sp. L2L1]|uniref:class I SAM-dependent methyltransferase n=1 Tax=Methylotenera sp. L2L1 TaxID=1502770 RepID=UPI001F43C9D4|nr:class I SAM-dependent methyltransferase [Methylotenera sp. L2L1]